MVTISETVSNLCMEKYKDIDTDRHIEPKMKKSLAQLFKL